MDAGSYIATGVSLVSLGLSVFSVRRSNRREDSEATDARIDERIQLALGADVAVIKNQLTNIQTSLANNANIVRNTVDATVNAITEAAREMIQISKQ